MTKKNLEIALITPEDEKSNELLLENLDKQVSKAQDSKVALEIKEIVSTMTPLPKSIIKVTKEQLVKVKEDKNTLVKLRTSIKASGKKARDLHNGINKSISAYENKIVELTEEEETKRKDFIKDVEEYHLTEERKKTLPEFMEKINECWETGAVGKVLVEKDIFIEDESGLSDYILTLDTTQRDAFYNECFAKKLEMDEQAIEDQKEADRVAEEEAEEKRLENLKKDREKQLPKRKDLLSNIGDNIPVSDDALNGMDDNQFKAYYNDRVADKNTADKQKIEDAEDDKKREAEEKKEEKLANEKEEKKKLADKKYQTFLKDNGWTDKTKGEFWLEAGPTVGSVILYKKVGEYKP